MLGLRRPARLPVGLVLRSGLKKAMAIWEDPDPRGWE